jgi:iron-sulfur cluster insertion protein
MDSAISLTDAAAKRVQELLVEEGNYNLKLRVYITGGGCSGFQYGFAFDESSKEDDTVVTKEVSANDETIMVQVVVDALSLMYLMGAQIDYQETLQGAHFLVKNPNAQTTCSCGSSFAL